MKRTAESVLNSSIFTDQTFQGESLLRVRWYWFLFLSLFVAAGLKVALLVMGAVPFNSDEAVVALMARHISQGARPVFFYGQAYMGSLDAWLIAGGFKLFEEHVWVVRMVQVLLYLGTMITTACLGKVALSSWRIGVLAAWLLAVPTVNVTLYTTVTLGGYSETLFLGNLILLLGFQIADRKQKVGHVYTWMWLLWGGLVGLGIWTFGLTLVYSGPMGVYLLRLLRKQNQGKLFVNKRGWRVLGWITLGGFLGSMPWWWFAHHNGLGVLLSELVGGAIAGVGGASYLEQTGIHLFSLLVLGTTVIFGIRPPWEVLWLGLPLLPLVLIFWVGIIWWILRRFQSESTNRTSAGVLAGVMATLIVGFVFSPFGGDPSGRYFLPMAVPLSLFAAEMIDTISKQTRWAYGLVVLVIVYNFWGTVQTAIRNPPGITTQFDAVAQVNHAYIDELMDFLREHGETRGYTNYWVTYPLAFLSNEELIFVPHLPYHQDFRHTMRDDRYAPYSELVAESERVAYITTNHPSLNSLLRKDFFRKGITWEEAQFGDYHVFFGLSRVVKPNEMGFRKFQGADP